MFREERVGVYGTQFSFQYIYIPPHNHMIHPGLTGVRPGPGPTWGDGPRGPGPNSPPLHIYHALSIHKQYIYDMIDFS